MDSIKEKIDSTIKNLEERKNLLIKHKSQYNDLKFKLMDFAQYKETDQPTVDIRLNSKAIVKGHIVNPQKVLVFLGCEYFVERDPSKAVSLVESKLKYLNKAIYEFEIKIKEAKKTIENIAELEDHERKQASNKAKIPTSDKAKIIKINEEKELPFMDIREELDEDGNVINHTIQKQDDDRIKEFGAQHGIKIDDDVDDDELNELLRDMEIKPRPKIEELPADKQEKQLKAEISIPNKEEIKIDAAKKDLKKAIIPEKDQKDRNIKEESKKVADAVNAEATKKQTKSPQDEYYELLKQMGISSGVKKEPKKNNLQPSKVEEIESAVESVIEKEIKEKDTTIEQQPLNETNWEKYEQNSPAIDEDDIIQLQLIADEVEEEGDYDYEYDEEDFEHAFDQDDDDDEGEAWELTPTDDHLIPESHRDLFMKELQRVRAEKAKLDAPVNTKDEPVTEVSEKKKKSVSFASELQIKEIEDVSEELKNAPEIGKVSKFKQMRMTSDTSENISHQETEEELKEAQIMHRAVVDAVVEEGFPGPVVNKPIGEAVTFDIIERNDTMTDQTPEPPKPRVSKFKQRNTVLGDNRKIDITGSIASDRLMKPVNDVINEQPTNGIMEREPALNDIMKKEPDMPKPKVSRFKSFKQQTEGNVIPIPVNDIMYETKIDKSLNDIMERETVSEELQPSKPKVSRFKSSEQQTNKGNIISLPKVEPHYIPHETELSKIKAYIEDDEDEEILLNELTDIQVLRPEDLEGEDEEDDEEDHVIYNGNVLADEIVENDETDDPNYYVDEGQLQKEYQELRKKMINQYLKPELGIKDEGRIVYREEEGSELEPIDEHGNPVRVSRFKKSYG